MQLNVLIVTFSLLFSLGSPSDSANFKGVWLHCPDINNCTADELKPFNSFMIVNDSTYMVYLYLPKSMDPTLMVTYEWNIRNDSLYSCLNDTCSVAGIALLGDSMFRLRFEGHDDQYWKRMKK